MRKASFCFFQRRVLNPADTQFLQLLILIFFIDPLSDIFSPTNEFRITNN